MKRASQVGQLLVSLAFLSAPQVSMAKDYTVDMGHSTVGFTVKHLVSKVKGSFKKFDGSFSFDPAKPEASKLVAEAIVASVDTNDVKRDAHLQTDDFFDAKKFPKFTFVSKKFTPNGDNKFKMDGDLTMRGVSKPVTFDVDFSGEGVDPWGNNRVGFEATTKVNRKDFGINWNKTLDKGGFVVGDEVTININVEGLQKK
jgi:polyisoprenoid-binding protein YceI